MFHFGHVDDARHPPRQPLRSGATASSPTSPGDLERELKYLIPARRMPFVERWLAALCRADERFGQSDVWTVYYDTPHRLSLREKLNSDYLKAKIRVRWYAAPGGAPSGDAFLEMKRRVGDRRDKVRIPLVSAAEELSRRPLDDATWPTLLRRFSAEGIQVEGLWRPVVSLVYRRVRSVDVASGARVSCDSAIRPVSVPRRLLGAWRLGPLPVGVVEIKSRSDELPVNLTALPRLGGRAASFSKYAAVWAHLDPRSA